MEVDNDYDPCLDCEGVRFKAMTACLCEHGEEQSDAVDRYDKQQITMEYGASNE
jgi:hypothetical protein